MLKAFRANSAPVLGSISVVTCMAVFGRRSPSTHSTYPVTLSRRICSESLRNFSTENFTGASSATNTVSSERMPAVTCSNTLYPKPCRLM